MCCIRLRVCTQDFYYNRLGLKPTSWFVHPQYTSLFLAWVNQFPRVKWAQFPLTSYFSPWRFTIWHAQPPYDHSFSFPTDHLKQSNFNSSTKKISLTSVTNSQAVVHKSWVARCSLALQDLAVTMCTISMASTSHSQSIHHKYFSLPAPLSIF